MRHTFSKQIQSLSEAAYRFANFELVPSERLLKRAGRAISIQPRAFDALHFFLSRAQHLVGKKELMAALWPSVHVSEANLTNLIGALRKKVGRNSIRTVSKFGYRFELPVLGEPGVRRSAYEKFFRARELTKKRSLEAMQVACNLYWTALAEDPNFPSAWAWLGRCCWFLDKFSQGPMASAELAKAALERAFALDPDLAVAHQFYTLIEVDTGRAAQAMIRLLDRLHRHSAEPETFAGLVQVFRFRGLLRESMVAHQMAIELDPALDTGVAHTHFLAGNYSAAIESYSNRDAYYLDAAAWAAMGEHKRAIPLLKERIRMMPLSPLMNALLRSLLATLQGKPDEAVQLMERVDATKEPEILVYFARHYAKAGRTASALHTLQQAADLGFVCSPETLRVDPWLNSLPEHREYRAFLTRSRSLVHDAADTLATHMQKSGGWSSVDLVKHDLVLRRHPEETA
jgi:DNA-binding winged helix-turn-helix (wHTH) protein/predicted Zn-dependent protease